MAHYRDKSCTISLSKVLNCTLVYTETFLLSGINIVEWMQSTKLKAIKSIIRWNKKMKDQS